MTFVLYDIWICTQATKKAEGLWSLNERKAVSKSKQILIHLISTRSLRRKKTKKALIFTSELLVTYLFQNYFAAGAGAAASSFLSPQQAFFFSIEHSPSRHSFFASEPHGLQQLLWCLCIHALVINENTDNIKTSFNFISLTPSVELA